ncbi:LysO family transporter [Desulfovibrio desulfuricans]|uniref:LysO family transporter n=1 Tax=Desulfovibrio desulfuricans TaxID=876 RepID=UPI0035B2B40F
MFIALGLTFLGMALGFLLRGQPWITWLTRCVTPAIMLLLFALGISVGGNETLMQSLPRLGGAALALTAASILGSFACMALVRRFFPQSPAPAPLTGKPDAGKSAKPEQQA